MYAVHYFFAKTKMSGFFQVCLRPFACVHVPTNDLDSCPGM